MFSAVSPCTWHRAKVCLMMVSGCLVFSFVEFIQVFIFGMTGFIWFHFCQLPSQSRFSCESYSLLHYLFLNVTLVSFIVEILGIGKGIGSLNYSVDFHVVNWYKCKLCWEVLHYNTRKTVNYFLFQLSFPSVNMVTITVIKTLASLSWTTGLL